MAGYGDELRLERERHGVSLEALSAETKINRKHLLSLEKGDFQDLPGGVFRRGMVRAYLKAVKLDEQTWMERFDRSSAEYAREHGLSVEPEAHAWMQFASNVKKNRNTGRQRRDWRWLGVVVLLAALTLCAWAVWRFEISRVTQVEPLRKP